MTKAKSRRTVQAKAKPKPAKKAPTLKPVNDCLIPPRVPDEVLQHFMYKGTDDEARLIVEYFEAESVKDQEKVTFLEKVQTEYVLGEAHDCWNLHTDKGTQWWVITRPTNLYPQSLFPSLDYTITFHLGLMLRLETRRTGTKDTRIADRLAAAFRRWEQAAKALDESNESEEIQAVGVRCREILLTFAKSVAIPEMVQAGEQAPKASDFNNWAQLIANHIAAGPSNEHVRGYLKAIAKESWQLAAWLTHASNATRHDGSFVLDATQVVIEAFGTALIRFERETPERCPKCASMKLIILYKPEIDKDGATCLSCGWEFRPDEQ